MERRQYGRRQIPSPARPSVEDDALAKKESEAFRRKRDLARETEERDHDRKQQVRDLAHFAIKAGIIVGFSIINCRPFFLGLASINA